MNNLTTKERKILNNVSRVLSPSVSLGDIVQNLIGISIDEGTPINSVIAEEEMIFNSDAVVIHGASIQFTRTPLIENSGDTYIFVTGPDPSIELGKGIFLVDVSEVTGVTASNITLTMDVQPVSGDTVTLGSRTYIFVPVGTATADGEVSIGTNLAEAQDNLVAAINGTDGINQTNDAVYIADFNNDDALIQAYIKGTIGDTIECTETFTAPTNIFDGTTLGDGADCPLLPAFLLFSSFMEEHGTQNVNIEYVLNDDTDPDHEIIRVGFSSPGDSGNEVYVQPDLTGSEPYSGGNDYLSGGIDGTPTSGPKLMTDGEYLYISIRAGTVDDTDWRRIELGERYEFEPEED